MIEYFHRNHKKQSPGTGAWFRHAARCCVAGWPLLRGCVCSGLHKAAQLAVQLAGQLAGQQAGQQAGQLGSANAAIFGPQKIMNTFLKWRLSFLRQSHL